MPATDVPVDVTVIVSVVMSSVVTNAPGGYLRANQNGWRLWMSWLPRTMARRAAARKSLDPSVGSSALKRQSRTISVAKS